jgi:peptide/nickel transport system ATP-binding protein
MALLEVQNLKAYFTTLRGQVKAVDGISFEVEKGEAMGLVGESGCGKTTSALTILGLLPSNGKIIGGKAIFDSMNLAEMSDKELREKVRWKGISLVFQGAMNALNPVFKVKDQIVEVIRLHEPDVKKEEAIERARRLIALVGVDPSRIESYPHELSGGMKQRVVIAMALANNPQLVIADEPATALDVIVQAQVLQLINSLQKKLGLSMILITHDLSMVAETCQKLAIMYAGKIVEYGDIKAIFKQPLHPYTEGLIKAFPNIKEPRNRKIYAIPGNPPDLLKPPSGCRFNPRCRYAMEVCKKEEPEIVEVAKNHYAACHLLKEK